MKTVTKILLAAAMSAAIAAPAAAEITTLARSGAWDAFYTKADSGQYMCGMSVYNKDITQSVQVKWFQGLKAPTLQVMKQSWRIPVGTKINVVIGFDKDEYGGGVATSFIVGSNGTNGLAVMLAETSAASFIEQFQAADKMWIKFPDGNEKPWIADMTGSRIVGNAFLRCVNELNRDYTQPYGKQPDTSGTQPYKPDGNKLPNSNTGRSLMRVQIPAYTDRWMMGDRYGEVVRVTRGKVLKNRWGDPEEIAHVKLDKSGKTVRVILADCEVVS